MGPSLTTSNLKVDVGPTDDTEVLVASMVTPLAFLPPCPSLLP
jgi:hypothetical protein